MAIEKTVTIVNKAGIHCRPSAAIIKAAARYEGVRFSIKTPRGEIDLKSLLALLSLGLHEGEAVTVRAAGPNEAEACEALANLFAYSFDFPPQN